MKKNILHEYTCTIRKLTYLMNVLFVENGFKTWRFVWRQAVCWMNDLFIRRYCHVDFADIIFDVCNIQLLILFAGTCAYVFVLRFCGKTNPCMKISFPITYVNNVQLLIDCRFVILKEMFSKENELKKIK